jgi:hypothetical protein
MSTNNQVVKAVTSIFNSDKNIASKLAVIVADCKNNNIKFSGVVAHVCGQFTAWPKQEKNTTRSKKGDVVSLSTAKNNKKYADFKASVLFEKINCFERNFRRYYYDNDGQITLGQKPGSKTSEKTDMQKLFDHLNNASKKAKAMDNKEVMDSIDLTLKLVAKMLGE